MESDRSLAKMPSLAKKSMTFLRDAYQMASHGPSSSQSNLGTHNQQSFPPSQGLSHHFNQTYQQQPYLRPHSPSHSSSWPAPQNHSTPDLGTHGQPSQHRQPQPFYAQPHPPYQYQQQHQYPSAPSHSPPVVSPVSPPTQLHPQWSGPHTPSPGAPSDVPPPYHSVAFQTNTAKLPNATAPQNPQPPQRPQTQKPVPPQVFSPDDYHEIWQSEAAVAKPPNPTASPAPSPSPQHYNQAPALPPRSPSGPQRTYQAPPLPPRQHQQLPPSPQQSFPQAPLLQHSYSPSSSHTPYQTQYPQQQDYQAAQNFQQSYQQPECQLQHSTSPVPQQQYQAFTQQHYSPMSPAPVQLLYLPQTQTYANFEQPSALHPPHPHTWPQVNQQPGQHQQPQPQASYFNYAPASQTVTGPPPPPTVSVRPPIAELPTPSPVQPQFPHHHHQGPYQQYQMPQQGPIGQGSQHASYQAYHGGGLDNKIPGNTYIQAQTHHPTMAELPG